MLSDDVAQARQGELIHSRRCIGDRNDGLSRIHNPIPQYGVDLHRDTVASNGLLLLGGHSPCANVDGHGPLDPERNDPVETGPAQSQVTPETEYHAALILLGDAESGEKDHDQNANGH